ncbi:hypothetical protein Nepgr_005359 [Nepenthes gracilis]|uniref:Uncharacterized protein n=1 Tax=Nepenthes gracilis TaxID=150966 RepID=A0AAD3S315_NEPGR|nr:hypothetical protein Nepgr_005359 [Nepenthes gracilis]
MVVDSILRGPGVCLRSWLPGLSDVAHCCSLCRFGSPPMLALTWCDDVDDFVPIGFSLLSWSGRLVLLPMPCGFAMLLGAVSMQATLFLLIVSMSRCGLTGYLPRC